MGSVTKNIYGNYVVTTNRDTQANILLQTHTVFIDGNLLVGGNTTMVTKTDMAVSDNEIVLNRGELGSGVTLGTAGIVIDRGSSPDSKIFWDETVGGRWRVSDGVITANIMTTSGVGAVSVVDDLAPQLGGNLDVLARTIFSSNTQQVKIDSNLAMVVNTVTPTAISNYNTLYAAAPDTGGSGVYQTSLVNSDELVSRNRALVFSLIL